MNLFKKKPFITKFINKEIKTEELAKANKSNILLTSVLFAVSISALVKKNILKKYDKDLIAFEMACYTMHKMYQHYKVIELPPFIIIKLKMVYKEIYGNDIDKIIRQRLNYYEEVNNNQMELEILEQYISRAEYEKTPCLGEPICGLNFNILAMVNIKSYLVGYYENVIPSLYPIYREHLGYLSFYNRNK